MKDKKYIVLLGDGMADYPIDKLQGRTPLAEASTPNMDRIASLGQLGIVHTIPEGFPPGSDVANMNLMGYDPRLYHTGRAPLEAASMGIHLGTNDVAFRCNLVYLGQNADGVLTMGDYSAGHISSEEARKIIESLENSLGDSRFHFFPGISYRHILVWKGGKDHLDLTPPHDITGEAIQSHLLKMFAFPELKSLFSGAREILEAHPVNQRREAEGKHTANSIWLWGEGKAPSMPSFVEVYQAKGAVISAVDLLKGIGVYAGLDSINVPGATGYLDTNYEGKVRAALEAFRQGTDFIYMHVEAPDEASHEGNLEKKILAIEDFDKKVVGPIIHGLAEFPASRILVATDHPTPIEKKTHVAEPVPFAICDNPMTGVSSRKCFCEKDARATGWEVEAGHLLISLLLKRESINHV